MIKNLLIKLKNIFTWAEKKLKGSISVMIVIILFHLFLVAYLYNNIVYTIESGQAGVLFKRFGNGTITDRVFSEGLYFIFPWDRLFIYNVRVQQRGHSFYVLTRNGLKVKLSVSVRYHPEYNLLGVLHQKVGPNYVDEIVIPEIESVLRLIVGQLGAEEIYTTKTGLIDKAINEAIEQISRRFVRVDDVIIKEVELPESVAGSIRYKIEQKHMAEAHLFKILKAKREAERKRIEAGGLKDYNDVVNVSLNENILQWLGIQATLQLSKSENSKVVIIGSGKRGLPIIGSIVLEDATTPGVKNEPPELEPDSSISIQKSNHTFIANPIHSINDLNLNEPKKQRAPDLNSENVSGKILSDPVEKPEKNQPYNPNQSIPDEPERLMQNDPFDLYDIYNVPTEMSYEDFPELDGKK